MAEASGMLKILGVALLFTLLPLRQAVAQSATTHAGGLDLSLRGSAEKSPEHTEYRALALLEVPLERAPAALAAPATPVTPARPATNSASQRSTEPAALPSRKLLRLARLTVRAGVHALGYAASDERLESMGSRSRSSAWLPELRFRGQTSQDQALRLTPTDTDPFRYTQSGQNALLFEGQATFHLARLVFADEELAIEKARLQKEQERQELEQQIIKLVFEWQRQRMKSAATETPEEDQALAELAALEAEARLDVLTGGWFSANWAKLD